MTEREQLRRVCRWNRNLDRENGRLRDELRRTAQECQELVDANANLRVELSACDTVLGAAMDEILERGDRPKGRS
jgi:hypothetical protein